MKSRIIIIIAFLLYFNINLIFAYEETKDKQSHIDEIGTWRQDTFPGSDELLINSEKGEKIWESSCGYFALTAIAGKNNTKPNNFTPIDLINFYTKPSHFINTEWGHLDFSKVEKIPFNLKLANLDYYNNITRDKYIYFIEGNEDQKLNIVRELFNKGYYIILDMENGNNGGHYISIDYIDPLTKKIRIIDSGFKGTWFYEKYGKQNLKIKFAIILEDKNGRKSFERKSVYTDLNALEYNNMIQEKKLISNNKKKVIPETIIKSKYFIDKNVKNTIEQVKNIVYIKNKINVLKFKLYKQFKLINLEIK